MDRFPEIQEFNYFWLARAVDQIGRPLGESGRCSVFRPNISISRMAPEDPVVTWDEQRWPWRLSSGEPRASRRDRIMHDLDFADTRSLPHDVLEQLRKLPAVARADGWVLEDRKSAVIQHLDWLFLRLCPQPDRPSSASRIAREERSSLDVVSDERGIRRAMADLATSLRIELPILSPGLPRNAGY